MPADQRSDHSDEHMTWLRTWTSESFILRDSKQSRLKPHDNHIPENHEVALTFRTIHPRLSYPIRRPSRTVVERPTAIKRPFGCNRETKLRCYCKTSPRKRPGPNRSESRNRCQMARVGRLDEARFQAVWFIARWIRAQNRPMLWSAIKADSSARRDNVRIRLAFGQPVW